MTGDSLARFPIAVGAAVLRDDQLLFARYMYGPWQGQWTFPSGYVEAGEEPAAAVVREVREETNLAVEVIGLVSVLTMFWHDELLLYPVFLARYLSGEPVPDGHEVDGAAFYGLASLDSGEGPFEAQNAFLARRILRDGAQILRPYDSQQWHETYRTTYA